MSATNDRDMRRDFANRDELIAYICEQFPAAVDQDNHISEIVGGRTAAEVALQKVDPNQYGRSRNFLSGKVTRLSPYIRYGVLSLAEVRDFALSKVQNQDDAEKLINELGWRDYWQRLYAAKGDAIWQDREDYKTGYAADTYAPELPADVEQGTSGMACIDGFSQQLRETGYLHNHQRMWMAAYLIHWRHIRWQVGARWFLTHLLDGDPASNNLSWQWVASTFSHKPYFFNRENLEKYTNGAYCKVCPLYGKCDFEGSYEQIEQRLFPKAESCDRSGGSRSFEKSKKRRR
jgi:deoxyribodipyrimidine photo-lyase